MKPQLANPTLADRLDRHTTVGTLCHANGDRIRCVACGHRCLIGQGKRGICKVRFNDGGVLKVPFGYVAGLQCDPVEKKPFFHVYPGSDALTFGMMGCDLHCSYCQNWVTSQALRDESAEAPVRPVTPDQLVEAALREGARLVVSSYNEPLITAEWAVAVFERARAAGLDCAFVSNGNATPEVLDFLRPWICAYKVDLKSFDDRHYRSLGGTLRNVLDTIAMIHERGIWLEIVTLVIPGFNDSDDELSQMARFLSGISRDIPWHVTAFHKDYRMTEPEATGPERLLRAAQFGADAGLRYTYAGNLPGRVGPCENTRCPGCGDTLIERQGYMIRSYWVTPDGRCPRCDEAIAGIWPDDSKSVRTGKDVAAHARRLPRPLRLPALEERPRPSMTIAMTIEQKEHLFAQVADLVHGLAQGQNADFADRSLGGIGQQPVAGVFVSLKRGKHLRACCGMLGPPIPLELALREAAARTVWEDARFPPVSPSEVHHLNMEVWLLHSPQQVGARGTDRTSAVVLGKHGIRVVRGQQHGLFLPSVAPEHEWDVEQFLDQACLKAGLYPTAWRDDETQLFTFEGEVMRGGLARDGRPSASRIPAVADADVLQVYADWCRDNINAILSGLTPNVFCFGAADGDVTGVILTLTGLGDGPVHLSQISLRPGLPLQTTLFNLTQRAAQTLQRLQPSTEVLARVRLTLAVFDDPVLHGTAQEPDLTGFDPGKRAVLVLEGAKSGLVYDPARSATEVLSLTLQQAQMSRPGNAAVLSLGAAAKEPLALSTAPRPVRGPAERMPAAAGTFYPADAGELSRWTDTLLAGERREEPWSAALVPHAGWVFSGRIAANALMRLRIPRTVIVIGPKHTALGVDWAIAPHQTWNFPGGSVESDFMLARQLAEAIPGLALDAVAHLREHAIEVELPLLARLAPQTRVVGIVVGAGNLEDCRRFAQGLASFLSSRDDRPLLLISSDMNHYAPDAENRRLDAIAMEALERLDPAALYQTLTRKHISMCGLLPAVIVLETLRLLGGLTRCDRIGYATSADAGSDPSRVVGYAGMLFD